MSEEKRITVRLMLEQDRLRLELYRETLRAIVSASDPEAWEEEDEAVTLARKALEMFGDEP